MVKRNITDSNKTNVKNQYVDAKHMKYIKNYKTDSSWDAQNGPLFIPGSNFNLKSEMRLTWMSMDILVRVVVVRLTHTEILLIKKLKVSTDKIDLEAETDEGLKKPDIGRVVESYFILPSAYSSSISLTGSDFILIVRICAVAITQDMSFETALAANFRREYRNI